MAKRILIEVGVVVFGLALVVGLVYLEVRAIHGLLDLEDRARLRPYEPWTQGASNPIPDQARSAFLTRMNVANAVILLILGTEGGVLLVRRGRRLMAPAVAPGRLETAALPAIPDSIEFSGDTELLKRRAAEAAAASEKARRGNREVDLPTDRSPASDACDDVSF
ncbi:MAG TPA: hypothetical protein DCM86_09760 [Verrucomicrobiales bacterium]|nr:hypothetical protein [Verrucomicrobiales bacterium]